LIAADPDQKLFTVGVFKDGHHYYQLLIFFLTRQPFSVSATPNKQTVRLFQCRFLLNLLIKYCCHFLVCKFLPNQHMKQTYNHGLYKRATDFTGRVFMRLCSVLLMCIIVADAFAQTPRQTENSFRSKFGPNYLVGYLAYTPVDYAANPTKNYPILIFLHGTGEKVWKPTNTSQLYKLKQFGPAKEIEKGIDFPFIVISPQCPFAGWDDITTDDFATSQWRPGEFVDEIVEKMKTLYRVDPSRIYITGLSMGGASTYEYIAAYPNKVAAAIPIAGWALSDPARNCNIASGNVAMWAFQGGNDNGAAMKKYVDSTINKCNPAPNPLAKITVYDGVGHDAWSRTYDNSATSENIYSWLMKYSKPLPLNVCPVAYAGADKSLVLPGTVSLTGSGTDSDGSVVKYSWTTLNNYPELTLSGRNTATVTISGFKAGTYRFRLTAIDNKGATGFDDVIVTVTSGPVNNPPSANAGADKVITLPVNSLSLTGTGNDTDGSVVSYGWEKVSGGAATLAGASSSTLSISGLTAGTYVFRLTVTDDKGAKGTDEVTVTVNANNAPVANAGADKSITLPLNSLSITGSGTDSDGSVVSYAWSKSSGGAVTITGATSPAVSFSGLVAGTYVFRLTVTDDKGASGSDEVTVVVYPAPSGSGNGLTAEYFNGVNLAGIPLVTRIDETVNFDWLSGTPDPLVPINQFSARWTGKIKPLYSESYTFYTFSDDGIRLYVNNNLVIDNWTYHGAIENTGTITLTAGQLYDIRLEYFEGNSMATAKLSWSSLNQQKQIVPKSQLYSNAPQAGVGLKGEYFNSLDFSGTALTRTDTVINFEWNYAAPFSGVNTDNFTVRWSGKVKADFTENYTFYTTCDDGVRLWVNNILLVNNWTDHSAVENTGTIALTAGQLYDIRLEYYEKSVTATAKLSWSSASQPKQIVPRVNLYLPSSARFASADYSADYNNTAAVLSAFPNPANDFVTVRFLSGTVGEAEIVLINELSREVFRESVSVSGGENSVPLNLADVNEGIYLVMITIDGKKQSARLVVGK
jgi:pimeloyl-ACP methyl ester carboxylesterase